MLVLDPNHLPQDIDVLQKIVIELCERLKHETSEKDKYRSLLRELLEAPTEIAGLLLNFLAA